MSGIHRLLCVGVIAATPALAASASDMLLESTVEPAQVYVQQQAIYRLRFYQAIDVRDLKIGGPSAPLADLRPIGEARVYEATRDGRRYRVHERSYAVFPLASGALDLAGAYAIGRVADPEARSRDRRRVVRLEAAPQQLAVRPIPVAADAAPWLPAQSVTLSEDWSLPGAAQPGDVLRRRIRIEASGVDAVQIPTPQIAVPGAMVHAEPARLENRFAGEINIGIREQAFGIVALHPGDIVVPELHFDWWDPADGAPATARLPARTVRVAATTDTTPGSADPGVTMAPRFASPNLLLVGALSFLVVAWVWLRRAEALAVWRLHRACRSRDAGGVRDGLLRWAARRCPDAPPLTLGALADRLHDPAARRALGDIERRLYGPAATRLDAAALRAAVRDVKRDWRRFARRGRSRIRCVFA